MRRRNLPLGRLALLLTAAAQPWCEAGAGARAQERLAARTGATFADWDIDIDGLHVLAVKAQLRDQQLMADEIVVTASFDGVEVRITGLVSDAIVREQAAATSTAANAGERTQQPGTDRFRVANAGVPIRVVTSGTVRWPLGRGVEARIVDPALEIDRDGWPTVHATGVVAGVTAEDLAIEAATAVRKAGRWQLSAVVRGLDQRALTLEGELAQLQRSVTVRDESGANVVVSQAVGEPTIRVEAAEFPLGHAGALLATLVAPYGVRLEGASVSGVLEATPGAAMRVHAEGLVVHGVVVEDLRLAPRPVRLHDISLDGDAVLNDGRAELQLVVGHGEARLAVGGHADAKGIAIDLDVAEMPCDALLEAMPGGTADALVGMRLAGDISAGAHLVVAFTELERARGRQDEMTPGELTFDFPFLERCRTLADPANVDLVALRGPYRHRFLGNDGRLRERVLAPGAPGFVPLGRVPKLASAFIGLEDMRFLYHDGFDREQIQRAFWHNIVSGRVRRGASTISQQTARNLWLGVDRSIARKLQEAYLTTRLETDVSKTRILELYVNLVELGPEIFGVDAAALFYFGIPATELDILQAVHLASLAPAPRTYADKWANGEVDAAWMEELRDHVRRMHRNRMVSDADLRTALSSDLRLLDRSR